VIYEFIYIVGITNTVDATFGRFSSCSTNPSFIPYSTSTGSIGDDSDAPPHDAPSDIASENFFSNSSFLLLYLDQVLNPM